MLQGGAQITPIGEQRVNNEFWSLIDQTNLARVTAAIDPANSLYAVAFPDTSASGGNPNHVFIYNWAVDRWAHAQPGALDMIFSAATQAGFTLEQLDGVSGSLDALPFSLDSAIWTGIARRLVGGFDTSHTLGFFSGAPMAATVDTTEAAPGNGRLVRVRSARPLVDGLTPALKLGTRNRQFDAVTWGAAVPANALGSCPASTRRRAMSAGGSPCRPGPGWSALHGARRSRRGRRRGGSELSESRYAALGAGDAEPAGTGRHQSPRFWAGSARRATSPTTSCAARPTMAAPSL